MNSEGCVKLSDFGISRQLDGTFEMSNTYVGTLRYLSPERLLGDGYNYSGDIWSVGVMMMELWTKTPPFQSHLSSPLRLLDELEHTEVRSTVDIRIPTTYSPHRVRQNILGDAKYPLLLENFLR